MQPTYPPPPPTPYPYPYPPPPPRRSNTVLIVVLCTIGGVVVLGILAAVAIPSFVGYAKKTKRSEAERDLERLYRGVERYQIENGALPPDSAGPVPDYPCCSSPGQKCAPDPALWEQEPWLSLGFSVDDATPFQYSYEVDPSGQRFTLRATGDLDCDGTSVDYTMTGTVERGELRPTAVTKSGSD